MEILNGLKFPLEDLDWGKKILIGGVLNTVPILNFISFGYALETMKMVMEKDFALPDWDEFGVKFMVGLEAVIISIVYMFIPIIIMGASIFAEITGNENIAAVGLTVAIILAVVIGIILPMAIANYVAKESMKAAFEFGEVTRRIKSVFVEYFICYIIIILLYIVAAVMFIFIPMIGWIIGAICMFYLQLVFAYYFGMLYIKSTKSEA